MRRPPHALSAALLSGAMTIALAGCGQDTEQTSVGTHVAPAPTRTRPAAKLTCPDVVWSPPAALHIVPTERRLVPFNATVLGIDTSFTGAHGITAEAVSGGYVDDLTEPYDDLTVTGHIALHGSQDSSAEVMHGSLQGIPVDVVMWRESTVSKPCDVHGLFIKGADAATARLLMGALR